MSRSILIVDDSELVRAALTKRLEASGAQVVCATSAKDALAIDSRNIAAAIIDVELGSDDGVSLADVLADRNPQMRLALFTARDEKHERETFRKPRDLESVIAWALKD